MSRRTIISEKDQSGIAPALHHQPEIPLDDTKYDGPIGELQLETDPVVTRRIPRRYRLLAFSMIIFFNTSSSFSESTLSPLKSTIRKELGVTSE